LLNDFAEAAIGEEFPPDTISTDFQANHIASDPPHGLPLVMSKLRAAGMPEREVFAAVTQVPARALRLDATIGALSPGRSADLTVLNCSSTSWELKDSHGVVRLGGAWNALLTVRDGEILLPQR
jgi:predicted amidohydrolase